MISHFCSNLELLPAERHPSQQKDPEQRPKEPGANGSKEGSVSEDVFTETELSPIREEEQASSEDLRLDKSSATSTESVQTVTQVEAASAGSQDPGNAEGSVGPQEEPASKPEDSPPDTATENDSQSPAGPEPPCEEEPPSTTTTSSTSQAQCPSSSTSRPGSQSSATPDATGTTSVSPQKEAGEASDVSGTDTMQQAKEEKENGEPTPKDGTLNSAKGKHAVQTLWKFVLLVSH